jgi:hypothetical protein
VDYFLPKIPEQYRSQSCSTCRWPLAISSDCDCLCRWPLATSSDCDCLIIRTRISGRQNWREVDEEDDHKLATSPMMTTTYTCRLQRRRRVVLQATEILPLLSQGSFPCRVGGAAAAASVAVGLGGAIEWEIGDNFLRSNPSTWVPRTVARQRVEAFP